MRPSVIFVLVCYAWTLCAAVGGEQQRGSLPDMEKAWSKVKLEKSNHARLLERQAAMPAKLAKEPVARALVAIDPDLSGLVTAVAADYDVMENPSEVKITITERGIPDDDLLGVRHVISMAHTGNNEWHVVEYRRGELRRRHFK